MPIYCAMGAVWPTRPGGSKMRPIENFWSRALLGLTVHIGANCDRRPPALRASNSRAFVFGTSARPCSLPSKSAGPLLLSRHLCPDGKKTLLREPYDSSVTLALTSCRPSPSCSRSLASCFRCPVRRFPLLVGWSQWEFCRDIVALSAPLSAGDYINPAGYRRFRPD